MANNQAELLLIGCIAWFDNKKNGAANIKK
jgi:hypothetical protein